MAEYQYFFEKFHYDLRNMEMGFFRQNYKFFDISDIVKR